MRINANQYNTTKTVEQQGESMNINVSTRNNEKQWESMRVLKIAIDSKENQRKSVEIK